MFNVVVDMAIVVVSVVVTCRVELAVVVVVMVVVVLVVVVAGVIETELEVVGTSVVEVVEMEPIQIFQPLLSTE